MIIVHVYLLFDGGGGDEDEFSALGQVQLAFTPPWDEWMRWFPVASSHTKIVCPFLIKAEINCGKGFWKEHCSTIYLCIAVISQEKTVKHIESFDKTCLKHAETEVKNPLPDKNSKLFQHCTIHCDNQMTYASLLSSFVQ